MLYDWEEGGSPSPRWERCFGQDPLRGGHFYPTAVVTGGIRDTKVLIYEAVYAHHLVKRTVSPLGIWSVCRSVSSWPGVLGARASNPFHSMESSTSTCRMPTVQPPTYCPDYRSEVSLGSSEGCKLPEPLGSGEGERLWVWWTQIWIKSGCLQT